VQVSGPSRFEARDGTVRTIGIVSIPSRVEAASILLELEPVDWLVEHSTAVAEVAAFLAARIAERGTGLDRSLVEAAALLHDLDKALPKGHPLLTLGHGAAGAAWLTERGHAELAPAVAHHPVMVLSDDETYTDWAARASLAERVVAYADKRAMQDVVSVAERFRAWDERHPERAESMRIARARAELLEREVCAAAGVTPNEVQRLPWVHAAMQAVTSTAR
jgi:putative nucleotidyltransferase with HDIG domain